MPAPVKAKTENANGTVAVTKTCGVCDKDATVTVPLADYKKWNEGRGPFIQDCFPYLSADYREILLSGTHPDCWDRLFGGESE